MLGSRVNRRGAPRVQTSPRRDQLKANPENRRDEPYRRPLAVYVVWHPDSEVSGDLANNVFKHICQDPANPLEWGLQIPVRFRSAPGEGQQSLPAPIPLEDGNPATAQVTAIVVLVDDKMLLDRNNWGPYVAELSRACGAAKSPHRFFPVMVSDRGHKLDSAIAEEQFIRVPTKNYPDAFLNRLTHELCRLILNRPRAPVKEENTPPAAGPAPVKVFLSHAKRDGEAIAIEFRDYINSSTQMKSFFDAVDIPSGSKWADVLDESSGELALLAIRTDAYATRPWCQREVLNAKDRNMPVVVLNALIEGEKRSFPYLGNTPTVCWNQNDPYRFETVLGILLIEVLRNTYFRRRVDALLDLYKVPPEHVIIANYPELLTAVRLSQSQNWHEHQLIIYPDPPIAREELARLMDFEPNVRLITPSMLPAYAEVYPT